MSPGAGVVGVSNAQLLAATRRETLEVAGEGWPTRPVKQVL